MRSIFASLALALAPCFLTYTQTLAPLAPHALPSSHPPTSPQVCISPGLQCPPGVPSPSAHSLCTPLAHGSAGFTRWVLTGAPQSLRRSGASLETGFSFPSSLTDSFFFSPLPPFAEGLTLGMGTPSSPSAPLLLCFTWQETDPRTRSVSPDQGLVGGGG